MTNFWKSLEKWLSIKVNYVFVSILSCLYFLYINSCRATMVSQYWIWNMIQNIWGFYIHVYVAWLHIYSTFTVLLSMFIVFLSYQLSLLRLSFRRWLYGDKILSTEEKLSKFSSGNFRICRLDRNLSFPQPLPPRPVSSQKKNPWEREKYC